MLTYFVRGGKTEETKLIPGMWKMSYSEPVGKHDCFTTTLWTRGPKGPLGLLLPEFQGLLLHRGCG